jgi:hypothetical protein
MRYLILTVLMGLLLACQSEQPEEAAVTDETSVAAPAPQPADAGHSVVDGARLNMRGEQSVSPRQLRSLFRSLSRIFEGEKYG